MTEGETAATEVKAAEVVAAETEGAATEVEAAEVEAAETEGAAAEGAAATEGAATEGAATEGAATEVKATKKRSFLPLKAIDTYIKNLKFSDMLPNIFPQKILFEMITAASAVFNIITSQLTVSNVEMIKNIIMNELKGRLQRSESNPKTLERYDKFVEFLLKEIEKNPTLISSPFVSPIVNGVIQSGGGTTWFTSADMLHNKL